MRNVRVPLLPVTVLLLCGLIPDAVFSAPAFPLKVSGDHRYLVDQDNTPFLIKEVSAWGLIQSLPEAEEAEFMDSVKALGFNTLLVSIISKDLRFAGDPPNWNGISPFTIRWDFSTPNDGYFEHADRVLEMARRKGLLVLLVPCYLGDAEDASQGWWGELLSATNSVARSRRYGRYLGNRYRMSGSRFSNLVWVAGGDNAGVGPLYEHMNAVIEGIRQYDPSHLWTGHFQSGSWSSDNMLYAPVMDLDGLYAWRESDLGPAAPQYRTELERYRSGTRMMFQLDQSYEHDDPHGVDNEDAQWIRRKNYDGLLCGCAGTSFSPGTVDNQCYLMRNWRPLMDTQGMREAKYCFDLFESRSWPLLVPDMNSAALTAGRGQFGQPDYVCAARTSNGRTLIAYLPVARRLTVSMAVMSGTSADAWWYNPSTGHATLIGAYSTSGACSFTPPSARDWVLVIDEDSTRYPPPGTTE